MQSEYKVQYGQTIYDIVLSLYGDLAYLLKLLTDNPEITSINFDFDSSPRMILVYDPTLKKPPVPLKKAHAIRVTNGTSRVQAVTNIGAHLATFGQSLYDICLMTYGSLDYIVKLCQDNNIGSVNRGDIQGKIFTFDTTLVNNNSFFDFLQQTGYVLSTAPTEDLGIERRSFNISFNFSFN